MPCAVLRLSVLPVLALFALTACGERAADTPGKAPAPASAANPTIPAITAAMQRCVDRNEIAGAVTLVADRHGLHHHDAVGKADIAAARPMTLDSMFWIASMTKPVTACAVLMLQDEGKLSVDDPVAKYLPEYAQVKLADGTAPTITLKHLLTHTAGLAEATEAEQLAARTLADLIPAFTAKPLAFVPGSQWRYSQTGINTLGRIVEVVSGRPFEVFLQERIFTPLGMRDTTFFPTPAQQARIATTYVRSGDRLEPVPVARVYAADRPLPRFPAANGGLYATAADYARFCLMLLNQGSLDGRQYLKPATVALMASNHTGDLKPGFTAGMQFGLGCGVVGKPTGVTAMLAPGTFGHGGAYGTQGWIDPVNGRIYVMMIQRAKLGNGDESGIRLSFQASAVSALDKASH